MIWLIAFVIRAHDPDDEDAGTPRPGLSRNLTVRNVGWVSQYLKVDPAVAAVLPAGEFDRALRSAKAAIPSGPNKASRPGWTRDADRPRPSKWRPASPKVARHLLASWLNFLMASAGIGRRVHLWRDGRLSLIDGQHEGCPLFGRLVIDLAGACTGIATQARCASCGEGFKPKGRAQRYCATCRRKGARLKFAQRALRERRRKAGLSARGLPLAGTKRPIRSAAPRKSAR